MKRMPLHAKHVLLACFLVSAAWGNSASAQWSEMLSRVPPEANSVVAVDIKALESSPLAMKDGWKEHIRKQRDTGAYSPQVVRILTGGLVKPLGLESTWEATVLRMQERPQLKRLADQLQIKVDTVGGHEAVAIPGNSYVVKLPGNSVGILHPADRQAASRWLRTASGSHHSEYLKKAIRRLEGKAQAIAALDLTDSTSPAQARIHLADFESLEKYQRHLDELAEIVGSVQGMTFLLTVTDFAQGLLIVDFANPTAKLKDYKAMMLELLADLGISLNEFSDWNATATGNTWMLQGRLGRNSIDRLLDMANTRLDAKILGSSASDTATSEGKIPDPMAQKSLAYFRDLGDLLSRVGDYKGGNMTQYGKWFRRYATKVEKLPTLGVDPDLIDFGISIGASLRKAASGLRGAASRRAVRQTSSNVSNHSSYHYRGYRTGYYSTRASRGSQRLAISTQARASGAAKTYATMDQIHQDWAKMRSQLTSKYNIEF